jgi:hypothetical protein
MREAKGDLWDWWDKGEWVCITTNGTVKRDGALVMGAGVALQAQLKWPELPAALGSYITSHGNVVAVSKSRRLMSFPVKKHWKQDADLDLIATSCAQLTQKLNLYRVKQVFLPRPGCGAGKLEWRQVKAVIAPLLDNRVVVVNV